MSAQIKDGCAIRAIHPRPEGRGFSRESDKSKNLAHGW
jgi:hypothetical protein